MNSPLAHCELDVIERMARGVFLQDFSKGARALNQAEARCTSGHF